MNRMLEKARELGVALANSPEYMRMANAKDLLKSDAALNALISDISTKREQLIVAVSASQTDSNYDASLLSADIERLQGQLSENPTFSEMLESEKAFSDLLSAINHEINVCIGVEDEKSGCNGNCTSCKGCSH